MSEDIVARVTGRLESAAFQLAVNSEISRRALVGRTIGDIDTWVGDLKHVCVSIEGKAAEISRSYKGVARLVGVYRGAWFARIWVFDLAFPVMIFLSAQACYFVPDAVTFVMRAAAQIK